jgi:general secretion pathway protein I
MTGRGFTLVEVLVALAILGIALSAALRAGQQGTLGFAQTRQRLLADWVAANRLAELRASHSWPDPGVNEGDAEQDSQRFHWRQTVGPTPNAQFRRVVIEVTDAEGVVLGETVGLLWRRGWR